MVSGVTELVMMKADVLSQFDAIKICTAYKIGDKISTSFPYDYEAEGAEPVYEEIKGWNQDLTAIEHESNFPEALSEYIAYIEKAVQVPISIVSVGPNRNQTIIRKK
jgi:adenylosuccinate synthase